MLVSVTEFFSRVPKSQGEAKQMLGAEWRSANPIRIQSNLRKCPTMIVYWQISYPSKARKRAEKIIGTVSKRVLILRTWGPLWGVPYQK